VLNSFAIEPVMHGYIITSACNVTPVRLHNRTSTCLKIPRYDVVIRLCLYGRQPWGIWEDAYLRLPNPKFWAVYPNNLEFWVWHLYHPLKIQITLKFPVIRICFLGNCYQGRRKRCGWYGACHTHLK